MNPCSVIAFLLLLPVFGLFGQTEPKPAFFAQGISVAARADSGWPSRFPGGFGLEAGYFLMRHFDSRHSLSADLRIAYAKNKAQYENAGDFINTSIWLEPNPVFSLRTGSVGHQNVALALPLRYRFRLKQNGGLFLMGGFAVNLNLWNRSHWQFDESKLEWNTQTILSEETGLEEFLKARSVSTDNLLLGAGFMKNKFVFDLYFSSGITRFRSDYISGLERLSLVMNVSYRL